MRLLPKFTLIFTVVFGAGLAVAAAVCHRFLQNNAREQVLEQARLMMETMRSARDYTSRQVNPLLQTTQAHQRSFLPQTVPAYAATETFNYLRTQYPDYAYKEAALNPTNLRDRAVDWEADLIGTFRRDHQTRELVGERSAATGPSLFLARPIRADKPCLECHDRARTAPAAMIRHYGAANGFGWNPGEIIGAQIVSVPMTVPVRMAQDSFRTLVLSLAGIFLVSLIVLDAVVVFSIARPVARLSAMADQISTGQMDLPELPVHGSDEISVLAGSFNRMRRSLQQALKMLGDE